MATKERTTTKTSGAAAYAELERRADKIGKDLDSSNEAVAKQAAAEWEQFLKDFEVWAAKYGLKIEERVVERESAPAGATTRSFQARARCPTKIKGNSPGGAPYNCYLKRASRVRGCIYVCAFDPDGAGNPFATE